MFAVTSIISRVRAAIFGHHTENWKSTSFCMRSFCWTHVHLKRLH